MTDSIEESANAQVTEGLEAPSSPQWVGWFRYYFDDQCWEWSDEIQQLHGYRPGTVVTPTTEFVLSHKHPDDRAKVAATIEAITHSRGAFSGRHRIIDVQGRVHAVLVVGDQFFDDGTVVGTHGFYVDVTSAHQSRRDEIATLVGEIAESRGAIERTKGMLMLIYDLDEDAAFRMLIWLSQRNNIKVRLLAERISNALCSVARDAIADKLAFDHALMTAHQEPTASGDPD